MLYQVTNSQLGKRVLSALVAIITVLTCAYFLKIWGVIACSAVFIGIAVWEMSQLIFVHIVPNAVLMWLFLILAALLFPVVCFADGWEFSALAISISVFSVAALWLTRERISTEMLMRALGFATMGFTYGVVFPSFAIKALLQEHGGVWFFLIVLIAFGSDTGAYFGGKIFGRRRLMPSVSPKKTIEGAITGGAFAILLAVLAGQYFLPQIPIWFMVLATLFTTFAAQSGDLLESLIKRVAHVKDSGNIMPGHGGMLDRLDGVYFAAPVFFAFILWSRDLFLS